MKSLCVATPVLAALVVGLPAMASAAPELNASRAHITGATTILDASRFRPAAAQQPPGSVRQPPSGGGGGGGGGGRSGGGDGGGGGRVNSGGGGGSDGGGAVMRGEGRRPDSNGSGSASQDRAVRRTSPRQLPRDRYAYYYRPDPWYYDRWGYGGFGLGYFYYSPWAWYGPGPGWGGGGWGGGGWGRDDGSVRLKVKPRDAEVLVDGYFAGIVDDFDGNFQSLKLDPGSYKIEVRKSGFETLTFDVRITRDRTVTFRGEMKTQ